MLDAIPLSETPQPANDTQLAWWQRAVIYQIYPRSFQDSNADGVGDLTGLLARLDYIRGLGVDAVWLSPVYSSPMLDFGYDIRDFTAVDPVFGSMSDLDELIAGLHARGIRLIMDFVPNHTSNEHEWFRASRASRSNAKRDWYVWRDPAPYGGPPNNWLSRFGGSAWTLDAETGQYYYHAFLEEQPDLNWRNPDVRRAMADVLRFWMKRGVDGFRIDASAVLVEDELLRNDPPNPDWDETQPAPERFKRTFTDDRDETLDYLAELRGVSDEFPERVLLGEVQGATDRISRFYRRGDQPLLHLPLNFLLLDVPWQADAIAAALDEYLRAIPAGCWPNWILGSHDKCRIATRIGDAQARVAAVLALTLPGTPIFYAGDEIGMRNVPVPSAKAKDPFERLVPGHGLNRDPERAPMRWDATAQAGFTEGTPWLPIGGDLERINAEAQAKDSRSMLALYRRLIDLRRKEPALTCGEFLPVRAGDGVLMFRRRSGSREITVVANVTDVPKQAHLDRSGVVLMSSHLDGRAHQAAAVHALRPDEALVLA